MYEDVKYWNRLPLAYIQKIGCLVHLPIIFALYSIFAPIWYFWAICSLPIIKYMQIDDECLGVGNTLPSAGYYKVGFSLFLRLINTCNQLFNEWSILGPLDSQLPPLLVLNNVMQIFSSLPL